MNSMLKLPTIAKPLVLNIAGHVPALKNQKIPITKRDNKPALISNTTVQTFYQSFYASGVSQINRQGFSRIPFEIPVMAFCELWFYVAGERNIAASDADNAWTTIQELLVPNSRKHPYYLGVLEDDDQMLDFRVRKYAVKSTEQEGARIFLWATTTEGDGFDEWDEFKTYYRNRQLISRNQPVFDFNEVLTSLSIDTH